MTITGCDIFPLRIPRRRAPKLGGRPTDPWASHVIVKLTTDTGLVGIGECRPHRQWSYETLESAATTLRVYLAPLLLGLDPSHRRAVFEALELAIAPSTSQGQPIAKSAVDMAVCDLLAKVAGQSLVSWLGGPDRAIVRTNALLSPTTPDEAAEQASAARARGFRSFKVNLGHGLKTDLGIARAVKAIAGDDYVLAEANQGYDYETALAVGRGLTKLGISAFEQPLRANQIADLRRLKNQLGVPVQLDESVYGPDDLIELLKLDAIGAVTLKVSKAGGVTRAMETARIAKEAGLGLAGSGLAEAGVGLAAGAAFFTAIGLTDHLTLNGPQLLVSDIVQEELCAPDGTVTVPPGLGLGVTLNEARLSEFAAQV